MTNLDGLKRHRQEIADTIERHRQQLEEKMYDERFRETATDPMELKGLLVIFKAKAKEKGFAENTIRNRATVLKILVNLGANLGSPRSVWHTIESQSWEESTKRFAAQAYKHLARTFDISIQNSLDFCKWRIVEKLPWIPLEREIDQTIAGSNRKTAAFCQLLKETGMRSGEAWQLTREAVDFERNIITLNNPAKHGRPRQWNVSDKLIAMLKALKPTAVPDRLWSGDLKTFRSVFAQQRTRLSKKLKNPNIKKIHFHTFRHFYATMLYHKTKDILLVKEKLGHRNINSTLIYTQIVDFQSEEYTVRAAENKEQASELLEAGFEYIVTTHDGTMLFRKRK